MVITVMSFRSWARELTGLVEVSCRVFTVNRHGADPGFVAKLPRPVCRERKNRGNGEFCSRSSGSCCQSTSLLSTDVSFCTELSSQSEQSVMI